jgi:hypothetical protein
VNSTWAATPCPRIHRGTLPHYIHYMAPPFSQKEKSEFFHAASRAGM